MLEHFILAPAKISVYFRIKTYLYYFTSSIFKIPIHFIKILIFFNCFTFFTIYSFLSFLRYVTKKKKKIRVNLHDYCRKFVNLQNYILTNMDHFYLKLHKFYTFFYYTFVDVNVLKYSRF